MHVKQKIISILIVLMTTCSLEAQQSNWERIVTNPLNLSYRFQTEGVCRREAADPVIILYNDKYYLFASHTSGYWYSEDLKNWNYIKGGWNEAPCIIRRGCNCRVCNTLGNSLRANS